MLIFGPPRTHNFEACQNVVRSETCVALYCQRWKFAQYGSNGLNVHGILMLRLTNNYSGVTFLLPHSHVHDAHRLVHVNLRAWDASSSPSHNLFSFRQPLSAKVDLEG